MSPSLPQLLTLPTGEVRLEGGLADQDPLGLVQRAGQVSLVFATLVGLGGAVELVGVVSHDPVLMPLPLRLAATSGLPRDVVGEIAI